MRSEDFSESVNRRQITTIPKVTYAALGICLYRTRYMTLTSFCLLFLLLHFPCVQELLSDLLYSLQMSVCIELFYGIGRVLNL